MRGRFFWRIGCFIGTLVIIFPVIFVFLLGLIANALGLVQIPSRNIGWIVPLGILLFLFGFGMLFRALRGLQHISIPFGNLIEAAERLSEGDYSARVKEQGPVEVRSLERAFNTMASRLQTSSQKRRDLLADVTHELRTPLSVIQGNVEGMLDGVYTPDESHLKSILDETQVLSRLVDDLRILALAESGTLELHKEPTDLGMLVIETVNSFQPQAKAAGISLETQVCDPSLSMSLDPQRFREVLINLISNALRYTPSQGTIQVIVERLKEGEAEQAVVSVKDTGPGIQPDDLPHVFERFYKSGDSGGMGLGLAIAKYIVEAHQGDIKAASAPGQGTLMQIRLPV